MNIIIYLYIALYLPYYFHAFPNKVHICSFVECFILPNLSNKTNKSKEQNWNKTYIQAYYIMLLNKVH